MNEKVLNEDVEMSRRGRAGHYAWFILPLLLMGILFFYFAPPLEWITVAGGDPKNPFAPKAVSGLVFNLRTAIGLFWYSLSALSAGFFLYRTKRFFSGHIEFPSELFPVGACCAFMVFIFRVINGGDVVINNCCGGVMCPPF